jgi:hypothetical protein
MAGYVEGASREQATLFPERLDELIKPEAQVRVVDLFVNGIDLRELGSRRRCRLRRVGRHTIRRIC